MNKLISINITADIVSWYAAIVATGMLIFRVIDIYRDNVFVKIRMSPNMLVHNGEPLYPKNQKYINIEVMNRGKRPITITTVGYISKGKNTENGILTDSINNPPKELKEGQFSSYLLKQDSINIGKIKYFVAYDATGRQFRYRIKRKDKLKFN